MFNLWSYVELIVYFRTVTFKNYPLQPAVVYIGIDGQPIKVLIVIDYQLSIYKQFMVPLLEFCKLKKLFKINK